MAYSPKRHQVFGVAGVAANPQEAVFKMDASQLVLEFPLHMLGQYRTLLRQVVSKRRVMPFDKSLVGMPCRKRTGSIGLD